MSYKLLPVLVLTIACGGEMNETPVIEQPRYNLPKEALERTLARSSFNGNLSAYEPHTNGNHWYGVFAISPVILAFSTGSKTSTSAYYLVDNIKTPELDFPRNDGSYELLYSLLLREQRASLDGQEADPIWVDYWLQVKERK